MRIVQTAIPDVVIVDPRIFSDERGRFFELWREERFHEVAKGAIFVQDNVSVSRRGVVRGLHFQNPGAQGKLVSVLSGAAWDVAVDVRLGSPTFGHWVAEELSATNGRQLWIPPGFAHGFQALMDETVFHYKVTAPYAPDCERTVRYDDPSLGIPWPLPAVSVAARDAAAPLLKEMGGDVLPSW